MSRMKIVLVLLVVGVSMSQWRYDESDAHQLGTKSSGGKEGKYKQIISSGRTTAGGFLPSLLWLQSEPLIITYREPDRALLD